MYNIVHQLLLVLAHRARSRLFYSNALYKLLTYLLTYLLTAFNETDNHSDLTLLAGYIYQDSLPTRKWLSISVLTGLEIKQRQEQLLKLIHK